MPERFRSSAARKLVAAVRRAGGSVQRQGRGQLKISGPEGSVTIAEPGGDTRRDLRNSSAVKLIEARTGLTLI